MVMEIVFMIINDDGSGCNDDYVDDTDDGSEDVDNDSNAAHERFDC